MCRWRSSLSSSLHSMEHASRATSSAITETCQCHPPLPLSSTFRLSAVEWANVGARGPTCSLPTVSAANKLQFGLLSSDNQDNDRKLYPPKYEAAAMLEPLSPAGSAKGTSRNGSTPRVRPQYTTSASSPPGTPPPPVKSSGQQNTFYLSAPSDVHDGNGHPSPNTDAQAQQIRARERVVILRGRVSRRREAKKALKDELRRLQEGARDATNKLMRKINETEALRSIGDTLAPYHAALREAQDALGPVDDEYDCFEDKLDQEEQDLEQEEDYFYRNHEVPPSDVSESKFKLDAEISPLMEPYIPLEPEVQIPPLEGDLVQEYLDTVSKADDIRRQMEDLEEDRTRFSGDDSFCDQHRLPIPVETSHLLAQYQNMRSSLLQGLRSVEDELFSLREQCLHQKLFSKNEHVYEPHDAFYDGLMDSVDEALDRSPLRMAASHANFYDREVDYENKREFVNNWLFQWVQDSTYEWLALKTWIYLAYPDIPEKEKDLADDKWSELALENWNKDSAGLYTNEFYSASMLDVITGNTGRVDPTLLSRPGISDSTGLDVELDAINRLEDVLGRSRNGTPSTSTDDGSTPPKEAPRGVSANAAE